MNNFEFLYLPDTMDSVSDGKAAMERLIIPEHYESALDLHETQIAIKTVKDFFQNLLAERLNLRRVSAPLFVRPESGLNDNLNGVERPVAFRRLKCATLHIWDL